MAGPGGLVALKGARSGAQFLERLDATPREIWYGDDKVTSGVSKHPAFSGISRSMADLYDMQSKEGMTYDEGGSRFGMSFLPPRTNEDLALRTAMMKAWADYSGGMLGRTPDYLNSALMAMGAASGYFAKEPRDFAANISSYYEYVRDNDLLLTHTLINPQTNRAVGPSKQADPFVAARVLEKNSEGVVVRGARMLATLPIADEIMVYPSTVLRSGQDDLPYTMAFALPVSAKGLKFICRQSFAAESVRDQPLASRFDEQDAVVVFDDVLVPWDRVFLLEDTERANNSNEATDAVAFMAHQATVRETSKAEFIAGVLTLMAETIGADAFPQVQERIAEALMVAESMKAFLVASEARAKLNRWGIMTPDFVCLNTARNLWPRVAPGLALSIKQMGASGLMATPPDEIMNSEAKRYVEKYYQAKTAGSEERIRLFKLAWDMAGSSFGGRQDLYERFFFGDPIRTATGYYAKYDKEPLKERVRKLLEEGSR
jgi:4-hydroxyphenylacetate 3-monooxygenase